MSSFVIAYLSADRAEAKMSPKGTSLPRQPLSESLAKKTIAEKKY